MRCGRFTSCGWRPRATDASHAEPLRPRTTHRPTLRQATALGPKSPRRQRHRHQGAHGEPHRSEPSSAVLASWATSPARFPDAGAGGSREQVPCPWLLVVSPERKRRNLKADCRGHVAFSHGYCAGSSHDSSTNGHRPTSSDYVAADNAPGLTAGARVARAAAVREQNHEHGAPTLTPSPGKVRARRRTGAMPDRPRARFRACD